MHATDISHKESNSHQHKVRIMKCDLVSRYVYFKPKFSPLNKFQPVFDL